MDIFVFELVVEGDDDLPEVVHIKLKVVLKHLFMLVNTM